MAGQETEAKQSARMRRTDTGTGPGLEADPGTEWRKFGDLVLPPFLEAAAEEFRAHGYHGGSVRAIAGRVGVTLPTLYYHHGSKQGLLIALVTGSGHDLLIRCRAALAEAGQAPEERLALFVECVTLYAARRASLAFLADEVRNLEPEHSERYAAQREEFRGMARGIVEDGVEAGVFATLYPVEAVRAILAMCQAVATWYRADGPLSAAEVARRNVALALDLVAFRSR